MKKENTPTILTDRLILRKFSVDDVQDMFDIYSDEEVNKFLPWFPLKSLEETTQYLYNNIFVDYSKDIAYRYAIVDNNDDKVIGYVSIGCIDAKNASGDLGYGLLKEYWGKSIIVEASRAILTKLKDNGFKLITATHDVNNPRSGKVMEKLGMVFSHSYDEMWQPKNFKVTFKLYKIEF